MPRINIDGIIVLSYDMSPKEKYWTLLSDFVISKHGQNVYTNHSKVEDILKDGFQFLVDEFRKTLDSENTFTFFKYVFWLHEESIRLMFKTRSGYKQDKISEEELARYRRILKLILEQGCEKNLIWGDQLSSGLIYTIDNKIHDLIYLGTWIYEFADYIAHHRMVENCHYIRFNEENQVVIDWQFHFFESYKQLLHNITEDYEAATFDEQAMHELKQAIESCFGIDYNYAGGIIFHLKEHHNPEAPELQTIEPYVLPINLAHQCKISQDIAETFYNGLSISLANKLSIEDAVYKPYSTKRYMFRPILIFNIEGIKRAIVGKEKFVESMYVLATNTIHWNAMLSEWLTVDCMNTFIQRKADDHDKILEDKIEEVITKQELLFCRNIESFKQKAGNNINFKTNPGEIDFIVINLSKKKIIVADTKYIRAKYEGVGFSNDYTKFVGYEKQIKRKTVWIAENVKLLEEHLKIEYDNCEIDIIDFEVEGVFFINTPTFYMFNGNYKAITLKQLDEFLAGNYNYPLVEVVREFGGIKESFIINHPYFRIPE